MMDSKNASMGMSMSVGDDGNVHDVMAEWFDICRSLAASSHAMPYASNGKKARRFTGWVVRHDIDGKPRFLKALSAVPADRVMPFADALRTLDASFRRTTGRNNEMIFMNGNDNVASQFVFMYAMNVLRLAITSSHAKWLERMGVPRALLVSFLDVDKDMGDADTLDGLMALHASDDCSDAMHVIDRLADIDAMLPPYRLKSILRAAYHTNLSNLDRMQLTMLTNCKGKDDAIRTAGMIADWHPSRKTVEIFDNDGNDDISAFSYYSQFPVSVQLRIMEAEPDGESLGRAWSCISRFMAMNDDGIRLDSASAWSSVCPSDQQFKSIMNASLIHAVYERDYMKANAIIAIIAIISGVAKPIVGKLMHAMEQQPDGNDMSPSPMKTLMAFDDEMLGYVINGYPVEFINETLLAKTADVNVIEPEEPVNGIPQIVFDPIADF